MCLYMLLLLFLKPVSVFIDYIEEHNIYCIIVTFLGHKASFLQ